VQTVRAEGQEVSADFFEVLRARFVAGRGFQASDAAFRDPVAIVSEGFWRSRLGHTPLANLAIQVNGFSHAVVGVVDSRHAWPEGTEVYLLERPRTVGGAERNNVNYAAIGRLKPGVSLERARADLSAIAHHIRQQDPVALYSHGVGVRPLVEDVVGDSGEMLAMLMGSVAMVLSSPAPTWPAPTWPRPQCAAARWPSALHLAPDARDSSGRFWSIMSCSRRLAARSAWGWLVS